MTVQDISAYRNKFDALVSVAHELEEFLTTRLSDQSHIDRVSCRAKSPESFASKAAQALQDGVTPKYSVPLVQIQDQIGARVLVLYLADVEEVKAAVERYFTPIELQERIPDSPSAFGYVGYHGIFALPDDVVPECKRCGDIPRFFELQIKTLFQHAWAEANHDLGYKPNVDLTLEQQRLCAYASAQAWGADRVFEELRWSLASNQE